jgi:alpha-mannosidase
MNNKFFALALAFGLVCGTASAQTNDNKPTAYMVADAHMDTQWNWDIQTTIRDYVWKTITQNLHLLKTYPNYIFNFEGAVKYNWMKEYYPTQYEEVKKYIADGRWHLTGSSWDANETVVVSPESWIRNILLGQTFYRDEFNKEGTDVFLPDCFGFGYDLPTLAAHCGLIGFSTQKLGWRNNPFYEGNKKYPFTVGLWQGIDGSRIMMTHGFGYGQRFKDEDISSNKMLLKEISESPLNMVYRYYGTGDTGGSPSVESVRAIEKGIKGNGPIKIISATSDQIYKDFLPFDKHPELPVVDGEMTMDVHGTGCYTSQAAMKLYNRQNEHLGDAAERSAVIAEWLGTGAYPKEEMTANWHRVLVHQFHDDLPGTSIPRAYEFSWNDELISLQSFSKVLTNSLNGIVSRMNTNVSGTPVVLYNNESFDVANLATVTLPSMAGSYTVKDHNGKTVKSQVITDTWGKRHLLFDAKVPATGLAVYSVKAGKAAKNVVKNSNSIENSVYKLTVDNNGNISSLIDKRYNKELVAQGQSLGLVVFDDCKSYAWPSWEILKETIDKTPVDVNNNVTVKMVDNGAFVKTLRVTKTYGDSKFTQYIRLYEGALADRVDIKNEVEWHSENSLLKANFPLAVSNEKATYDLGLGSIQRGNNTPQAYEVYSHDWTDLTDKSGDYGVTILNDSKYGWDKPNDNTLRLSLLYAPKADKGYVYQEQQDMGYHEFTYSIIGHKGELDKAKAVEQGILLNSPIYAFTAPKHKGSLGKSFSFVSSDNSNVTVRAIKKAEKGNEYVVRVYENSGKSAQNAILTFAADIVKAVEADGTEKEIGSADFGGKQLKINIKPFSVKTYKVSFSNQTLNNKAQENVALPYNKRCFSYNEFRNSANFSGGYSYAAELLPDEGITVDGIHFAFGHKDGVNGVACNNDTIEIPAGNKYNRLYVLCASTNTDNTADFLVDGKKQSVNVPYYSDFVGQWGHDGHTEGFLKDAEIAYVGTHRHSAQNDEPYEFTYMFKQCIEIPKDAKQITFPKNENIVVFSAVFANENEKIQPVSELFRTGNRRTANAEGKEVKKNLLAGAKIIASSGEVNEKEKAENIIDGNKETKWCDTNPAPNFVALDLGKSTTLSGWKILNAGIESSSYITRTCLLQVRNSTTEDWNTVDILDGNRMDSVTRSFKPVEARYVRLYIVAPSQGKGHDACRVYELEVY